MDATITDLNATLSDLLIFSRDFALLLDYFSPDLLLRELSEEVRTVAAAHQDVVVRRIGEHRVRFFAMGSEVRFVEQCRWCWHAWDEQGRAVL